MAVFDYIERTDDFKFRDGDFVECWFMSTPKELTMFKAEIEVMIRIEQVSQDNRITKFCVVKGPENPPVIEYMDDGTIKSFIMNVYNDGYVDIANENGIKRWKTIVPEIGKENTHFILGNIVARPLD